MSATVLDWGGVAKSSTVLMGRNARPRYEQCRIQMSGSPPHGFQSVVVYHVPHPAYILNHSTGGQSRVNLVKSIRLLLVSCVWGDSLSYMTFPKLEWVCTVYHSIP